MGARQPHASTVVSLANALGLSGEERRAFEHAGLTGLRERRHDAESGSHGGSRVETTPDRSRHNLGMELTSFIGREAEIADLRARLASNGPGERLVTLTGSGGCGKTRLARWVARDLAESFSHGA